MKFTSEIAVAILAFSLGTNAAAFPDAAATTLATQVKSSGGAKRSTTAAGAWSSSSAAGASSWDPSGAATGAATGASSWAPTSAVTSAATGAATSAASGAATSAASSAAPSGGSSPGGSGNGGSYKCYSGNPDDYPKDSTWLSADALWALNKPDILASNNGDQTIFDALQSAIKNNAQAHGVDERIMLSKMMQESSGKATVPCTSVATQNCGVFQGPQGTPPFQPSDPKGSLDKQAQAALMGAESGGQHYDGFVDFENEAKQKFGQQGDNVWVALRFYNSGQNSLDDQKGKKPLNLNEASAGTTGSYVNDIANRVMGWRNTGGTPFASQCASQAKTS